MFRKPMKMRHLEVFGVPSYILDVWEKHYSSELMPVQEKAVRHYGILEDGGVHVLNSYRERIEFHLQGNGIISSMNGTTGLPRRYAPRNDIPLNYHLLVIAPTSSGKTFIGEMSAVNQAVHNQKTIYLVPLRTLAEEKYRRFKKMYHPCGIDVVISSRDRKEDDKRIGRGHFKIAVMIYEKFYYFLLKHSGFLSRVSLVVIDEVQIINDPVRGPLLEEILAHLQKQRIKTICLSAFLENQAGFLKCFSGRVLTSYTRPVELRKGIVREGVFKYITHNEKKTGEEVFFHPLAVRDNCREDYLLQTVRCLVERDEPVLLFFPTRIECKKWAQWLADRLDECMAKKAIEDLSHMDETLTKDNLLALLEKGVAYHNSDLSWEERNLVEHYLQNGEIKVVCATTTLAMGVNLPFKNVILSMNKIESVSGKNRDARVTHLNFSDIENMGGRAGRLNTGKKEEFGRVIFLAHSRLSESIYKNLYFKVLQDVTEKERVNGYIGENVINKGVGEALISYPKTEKTNGSNSVAGPKKSEKDLSTLLLRLIVNGKESRDDILAGIHAGSMHGLSIALPSDARCGYWHYVIDKRKYKEKISETLSQLKKNHLIIEDDRGKFSATDTGILIIARGMKVDTYLYFLSWLSGYPKGKISILEILFVMSFSEDGKAVSIPYPQFYHKDVRKGKVHYTDWKEIYRNKLLWLVFELGEEEKAIYREEHGLQKGKTGIEEYLAYKKVLLLYDWISNREIRSIEQEYSLYHGAVKRLGEGFSWLADSLAAIACDMGWNKEREEDVKKIRRLSERLVEGVEEVGLPLSRLHIPGLTRSYIQRLVKEGYEDEDCLKELGKKELSKVLPGRLVTRIRERIKDKKEEEVKKKKKGQVKGVGKENKKIPTGDTEYSDKFGGEQPQTILEIDKRRPDRILFEGKEVNITTRGFSLLYLLAKHSGQVIRYEEILKVLWKDEENAIYTRINYHICKIKKDILEVVNSKNGHVKRIGNIFKTIPGRGLMLDIQKKELLVIEQ